MLKLVHIRSMDPKTLTVFLDTGAGLEIIFVFAINDGEGLAIKYLQTGSSSVTRQMPNYLPDVLPCTNDVFAVYINVEKGLNLLKTIAKAEGNEDKFAQVETVLGRLGE